MTIYLDVVLLENVCMNYIILFATSYIMKVKIKQWKVLLSSVIRWMLCGSSILKYITNIFKYSG